MVYYVRYLLKSALCPQLAGMLAQESGKLGCSVSTGSLGQVNCPVSCVLWSQHRQLGAVPKGKAL